MLKSTKYFFYTIVVFLFVGVLFQQISAFVDSKNFEPTGTFTQVETIRMYSETKGNGPITIVFDSSMGNSLLVWQDVVRGLAPSFRTFAYDRAGLGYSEESSEPRTSQVIVKELHALLQARAINGPIILVGHYFGGLNMQLYAKTYPEQVKGLVLVNSAHSEQLHILPPHTSWRRTALEIGKWASPIGIPRLYLSNSHPHHKAVMTTVKHQYTSLDEAHYFKESANQVEESVADLGNLPIVVLTKNTSSEELRSQLSSDHVNVKWAEMQESFLSLSRAANIVYTNQRSHNIHRVQPQLVVDAVQQIAKEITLISDL